MGMADLAARSVSAFDHMSVDDNAAADAGSERNHDDIFPAFRAAFPHLAEGCDIGVISSLDGNAGNLTEFAGNIRRPPVKVYCIGNLVVMYRARYADTGPCHFGFIDISLCHLCQDCLADIRKDTGSVVIRMCTDFPFFKKSAIRLKQTAFNGSAADIDAETILLHYDSSLCCNIFS